MIELVRAESGENLIGPRVHMNGTSREELLETYITALEALRAAYEALTLTAPNGRDYYLLDAGALPLAVNQHRARLKAVAVVITELAELAERLG